MTHKKSKLPDATIIMTFHGEGIYAHKSLLGFQRIRDYSAALGNNVNLICILDNAEKITAQTVKNYLNKYSCGNDQIIETSFGQPAAARNIGIDHTNTEYVGFIDGDDFFSANWVNKAVTHQIEHNALVLSMPSQIVNFGHTISIQSIVASQEIPQAQMINMHYWVASSFGRTEVFKQNPYNETVGKQSKFAFEDYDFNLRCIAAGIQISPVKQTYLFYRRRKGSMLQEHVQFSSMVPPSDFFLNVRL